MNEKNEMISRIRIAVGGSRYSEKAFEYGLYLFCACKCSLLIYSEKAFEYGLYLFCAM